MEGRLAGLCSCCGNRGSVGASLHSTQFVNLYTLCGQLLLLPHVQTAALANLYAVMAAHAESIGSSLCLHPAESCLDVLPQGVGFKAVRYAKRLLRHALNRSHPENRLPLAAVATVSFMRNHRPTTTEQVLHSSCVAADLYYSAAHLCVSHLHASPVDPVCLKSEACYRERCCSRTHNQAPPNVRPGCAARALPVQHLQVLRMRLCMSTRSPTCCAGALRSDSTTC